LNLIPIARSSYGFHENLLKSNLTIEEERIMTHEKIQVEGMTCGHCVETVTQAVNSIEGVSQVLVDLKKKQVSVDFDESRTDMDAVSTKITEVGFEVVSN